MGIAWSHCVNTRIALERTNSIVRSYGSYGTLPPDSSERVNDSNITTAVSRPSSGEVGNDGGSTERAGTVNVSESVSRRLKLIFSPCRPAAECRFIVNESGVFGV